MEDDQLAVFYLAWQGFHGPVAEKGNFFPSYDGSHSTYGCSRNLAKQAMDKLNCPKEKAAALLSAKGVSGIQIFADMMNRRREEKLTNSWDLWMQTIGEITGGDCGLPRASYGRDGLNSGPYCWYMDMLNYGTCPTWTFRGTSHVLWAARQRRTAEYPLDDEVFIAKHEHHYSPMCPQHLPNLTIPSSPTRPITPLPILLNHLTDPMMGKIILGAVSEAYNHPTIVRVGNQKHHGSWICQPFVFLSQIFAQMMGYWRMTSHPSDKKDNTSDSTELCRWGTNRAYKTDDAQADPSPWDMQPHQPYGSKGCSTP
ncbi:hypothetical protein EDC04DRAFT_2609061 [Pisolithus marmoratus]|nr:hypothetical protein EDC04DRAFT_2609061 [Pisolithus marmoratus]